MKKTIVIPKKMSKLIKSTFLCGLLLLAFWVRFQGADTIPHGQFASTDAYFYYHQAKHISEHGYLPARDMDRWLPLGRDN